MEQKLYLTDLANVYDYLGKSDTSIILYDSLMHLYPDDNQPYYEKGVVFTRQKKYDMAIQCFQKSLLLNPYHTGSHIMLGSIYTMQGRLSEAYIALEYALLVTNSGRARKIIGLLNTIALETDEVSGYYAARDKNNADPIFDEIDQIVNAKLALNSEYKLNMAMSDNLFRQGQVIMEKLKYDAGDTNFVMQYYVPLLAQVYANGQFEEFTLEMYSNFGLEEVEAQIRKNKSAVADIKNTIYAYLDSIRGTRVLNYAARKQTREKYFLYSAQEKLTLTAYLKDKSKPVYDKGPAILYRNYTPVATGNYNDDNKKDGLWKYYYSNGNLREEEPNKNGKVTGDLVDYYENGNIKEIVKVGEDEQWTSSETYDERGYLYSKLIKRSKTRTEKTIYADNGAVLIKFDMENGDMADGHYKRFFDNGKLNMEYDLKNQKANGKYVEYFYDNDSIEEQGMFDNGDKEGEYTTYYKNGKIRSVYTYSHNKLDGAYTVNDEKGLIEVAGIFKDDKEEGPETRYDEQGKKFGFIDYKKGVPVSIKFIDAEGKTVFEQKNEAGIFNYSTYFANGNKNITYSLDKNGDQDGLQTTWYYTGSKKSEVYYKAGKKDGRFTQYQKNGKIDLDCYYKNNLQDGYYTDNFYGGQKQLEGWMKEGKKQGTWINYYLDGKPFTYTFYNGNSIDGYQDTYGVDGKIIYKEFYKEGMMTGVVQYATDGSILKRTLYKKAQGLHHIMGSPNADEFICPFVHGKLEGEFTRRYSNGKLKEKGFSKDGNKDSNYVFYNCAGVANSCGKFKDGRKEGEWKYCDDLGNPTVVESYKADKETGKSIVYANGSVRIVYNFVDGEKDGPQVYYGEDSLVAGILIYKYGELVGYASADKMGMPLSVTSVKNGTASVITYYPNGNKGLVFNFAESDYKGRQLINYSNGNEAEERNYTFKMMDGERKKYTADGKLYYKATYKDDELNGHEIYYNKNNEVLTDLNYYNGYLNGKCIYVNPDNHQKNEYAFNYGTLL